MQPFGGVPPLLKSAFVSVSGWAWEAGPRPAHAGPPRARSRGRAVRGGSRGFECPPGGRQEASRPRRPREGTQAGGVAGSWHPTNWLPAKQGELLGKSWARLKCQGHRSRRTAGAEMWVTAAGAPGMLGGASARPSPRRATAPRPPWGEERLLGTQGPRGPPTPPPPPEGAWASAGDRPAQPSRWLGRRPVGPSPAPQPDTGEARAASSLFPEEAASQRQASQPGILPRAARKAGGGLTP